MAYSWAKIDDTSEGVSLVRGGPFYRLQQILKLIDTDQWNLARRISVLLAVSWLPLFVITIVAKPSSLASFIRDYRVASRLLIAVPVLLFGEVLMETRFRSVLSHIRRAQLLGSEDAAYMDNVVERLRRLRDSLLPEIVILGLIFTHTAASYKGLVDATPWLANRVGAEIFPTAAGWYAIWVSATVFQFLLGLGLWKWMLWTYFSFQLSRRDLNLIPTHPDAHGGLGFLGLTVSAFAPIAFAGTTVIGATWREEILKHEARLMDLKLETIVLVAIIAAIALGPLTFFVPRLAALRRQGLLEYGFFIAPDEKLSSWTLQKAAPSPTLVKAMTKSAN
jgi:hypothetical protein